MVQSWHLQKGFTHTKIKQNRLIFIDLNSQEGGLFGFDFYVEGLAMT